MFSNERIIIQICPRWLQRKNLGSVATRGCGEILTSSLGHNKTTFWSLKFILLTMHPSDKIMLQEAFHVRRNELYTLYKTEKKSKPKRIQVGRTILGQSLFKIIHSSMKYSYRKYINTFPFYVTGIQYKSDFNVHSVTYKRQNFQICSSLSTKRKRKIWWGNCTLSPSTEWLVYVTPNNNTHCLGGLAATIDPPFSCPYRKKPIPPKVLACANLT